MKKCISVILISILLFCTLISCSKLPSANTDGTSQNNFNQTESTAAAADLGDASSSFGDTLDSLNLYKGYFEGNAVNITINCISGSDGCFSLEGNVLTFTNLSADSVYSVSGQLNGNIVIDVGDDYKFDLELQGLSLISENTSPITILSGDEVAVTAKSGYDNYIYDKRKPVADDDASQYSAAIYSKTDLKVCGKGSLTLVSENNNGIHSKDDLKVKNLTLFVVCNDNAIKGNDSVSISDGSLTLIARQGDGIKTANSNISSKGKQRGTVTISGGSLSIYAACDGIDAAYNTVIDNDKTSLNIYTDKYSSYSEEINSANSDVYYIRFSSDAYKYAFKYYNSDDDYTWMTAKYHSKVSGTRTTYYYYSIPKMQEYEKFQFFMYSAEMTPGQEENYLVMSDYLTPSTEYDTFALTIRNNSLSYDWTNYTTAIQDGGGMGMPGGMGGMGRPGGMDEGNSDKGDHSAKGIKAGNEIIINAGCITIKSYDDSIHANSDETLENGEAPTGNITINGGTMTLYTNDDGIHADGTLNITNGTIYVINSYEGLEAVRINISGGNISISANDDGINGTATTDTAITISGGNIYIYCTGDGIDSNSRTSFKGIVFSGGNTVIISNSGGNSAIDTERGYEYSGGSVIAVMPTRGMTGEVSNCSNFSSVAVSSNLSLTKGSYLTVSKDNAYIAAVSMPLNISARVVYLGDNSVSLSAETECFAITDSNGVYWK